MSSGLKLVTLPAITVTSVGERKPIHDKSLLVYEVTIQSIMANTGTGYIGDETVTSANGQQILPGDPVVIELPARARATDQFYINEIYIDASVAGTEFRVSAWIRE